jgi:hypothetical protein
MQFSSLIRPVLVCVLASSASACGMVDSDPNRFENLAGYVADIPVSMDRPGEAKARPVRSAAEIGLRSARAPLKVEVMDPHELWDARDGMVQDAVARAAPAVIEAAAPMVARAATREVQTRLRPSQQRGLRPAVTRPSGRLVQLGAFASQDAARNAWIRLKSGQAARYLADVQPVYEAVRVNGRNLVRLKVAAPAAGAAAVCAAARINDPWCTRGT